MTRSFVLGLDGGSWLLAEPWMEAGKLPNLQELRESGVWATSRSCLPPVTFPNWKCYSTGKNPGKFGVYWFERIDLSAGTVDIMNRHDFRSAEFWDYLNAADIQTGVINMPTMYPPREIDGVVVAGGPDAVDGEYRSISGGYTTPASFERELVDRYDYRVHPDPLLSSNEERGAEVDAILELLETRLQVAIDLFTERDLGFLHLTLFYLNVLHHFFWDDEPTLRAWQLVDEWLGRLADLDDTNLYVMSDHGSAPTTTEFYINEWFASEGYLTRRQSIDTHFRRLGLTRENVLRLAKRAGLVELLADIVPERVQELVPQAAGAKRERKLEQVILEETRAIASGQGPIYLNPSFDVEAVRDELIEDLRAVTDGAGDPLFEAVHRGEDVYHGPYTEIGPEVVIEQRPGVHVNDGIGKGLVRTTPDRWAAENTRSGLFVATGPDIEAQGELDEIEILDLAPTILAGHGVDIPADLDGSVLPIFTSPPDVGTCDPIDLAVDEGARHDEVADRLKQLGYME